MAFPGMNIETLPPEGETKYPGQLFTFKNAVQVEFEYCINCLLVILMSHSQELTPPKHAPRDTLKLFDATVTPSLFYSWETLTMMKEMKKKLQTTQRWMRKMIIQKKRQPSKGHAAAHVGSVDDKR